MLTTNSPEETEAIAKWFADNIDPTVIALVGTLGMGKTCFAKGFLSALGMDKTEVSSPTFSLLHEYETEPPVLHLDIYRLEEDDLPNLGLDERIDDHIEFENGFVLVEWADRHPRLMPPETVWLTFSEEGDQRIIHVEGPDVVLERLGAL